jgi:dipeptidyl aminopeptidase/acylaminoacyl peptidase
MAGVSYGAYLTAFAITQTRRFAAVSLDDGPTDLRADYGVNYAFHSRSLSSFFGGTPWTKPEVYAAQSPITFVARARTPVLMRYGGRSATGDDVRQAYMLSQGFEFYAGLHDAGVPVQFILHPDQGHGIADWDLYKDWVSRNLRWFDFWLRHEGANPTSTPE